jgi:uncharacterized protein YjbJ (UPF0337 family)
MDKDRVAGAAHQVKGAVKEAVRGAAEKAAGKVQKRGWMRAKDAVRDSLEQ